MSKKFQGHFFATPTEGRLIWVSVVDPSLLDLNGKPYDKPRYELTFVFKKEGPDQFNDPIYRFYSQKAMEVFQLQHGHQDWNRVRTDKESSWPIKNCDEAFFLEKNPWAAGCWKIKVWSQNPPKISDARNNEILREDIRRMSESPIKSGDYGFLAMNFWSYEFNGINGISGGLEGVKISRQGDPVGGIGRSVEAMFGASEGPPVYGISNSPIGPGPGPMIDTPSTPVYGTGGPGGYGAAPPPWTPMPTAPVMPPPPPVPMMAPVDSRAQWIRSSDGQFALNPNTRLWEPAPPASAAPPPAPIQSGYVPVQPPSGGPSMPPGFGPSQK